MGQKQKTEEKKKEKKRERLNNGENNGQATHGARKHAWRTQAAWANILKDCKQIWHQTKKLYKKTIVPKLFFCPVKILGPNLTGVSFLEKTYLLIKV